MKRMLFPSLKGYKSKWLRSDIMAALVVTAIAIPQSLGYAVIVGLPVQAGLYCALLAPIIYALFATSKRLMVGADSATAVLVAAGAATVAVVGTDQYANVIGVLGLLTAIVLLVMAVARLGFLADLISQPVLIGFIAGVGVQLLVGKFPEMLGLHATGGLLEKIGFSLTHLTHLHPATAIVSLSVVAIVMAGWKFRWPGALIALLAAIIATKLFALEGLGVSVIGAIPAGLPTFHLPSITPSLVWALLPTAISIAIVILTQSLAVIRSSAARHDEKVKDNQDLAALGFANISSALIGGFAINGSPPRTSAAEMAGGRSQLVNIFMSLSIGVVLLAASGLFELVPTACLSAIVFTIGLHLVKFQELHNIWKVRRSEFGVAMIALGSVAILGVQTGVLIAVAISLVDRLHRQYRPHDEILLRDKEFAEWANIRFGVEKKRLDAPPGLLIYRFNDALFFENAGYFLDRVAAALKSTKEPVRYLVLDAGAISDIDYTAAQALKRLHNRLETDDIQLAIAHVQPKLRVLLNRYGLTDIIGTEHIYPSVRGAIEKYTKAHISNEDRIRALALSKRDYIVISGTALELMGIRETNDVDIVVNKATYDKLRAKNWKEYVLDDGKRVLSHHGYKVMMKWMGYDLKQLQKTTQIINGIPVMGLEALIDCKNQMGRVKDEADIRRIRKFQALTA